MTPVQKAIDILLKRQDMFQKKLDSAREGRNFELQRSYDDYLVEINSTIQLLQSLLPVEQQMMCEFAEWLYGNYVKLNNSNNWVDGFDTDNEKLSTTNELLQLFNNKNDK